MTGRGRAALALLSVAAGLGYAVCAGLPTPQDESGVTGAGPSVISGATPHLTFTSTLSADSVSAGQRISITTEITPAPGIYVYAPGTSYQAVVVRLEPDPFIEAHDPVYSKPITYFFEPLQEQVLVYKEPFRLVIDLTVGPNPRKAPPAMGTVVIKGELEYQACDDRVCYLPASVPIEWSVKVKS